MKKQIFWIGTGILGTAILVAAIIFYRTIINPSFHGSVIQFPVRAADFTLTDQDGEAIRLSALQGKYVLLFFGYTNCDDECPATLAVLTEARRHLGRNGQNVEILVVTTDPEHDSPPAMREFVDRFDPTVHGATGTETQLQPVWASYGVTVEEGGETHSTYIYLIDPDGKLRLTYAYPVTPEKITADLKALLRKN